MREEHIAVPKSARYATLGTPGSGTTQLWVVCHGYGQLAPRFLRRFEVLDDGSRWIVAPEGLSRYYADHASGLVGASWMTKEDRLTDISDYVRYLNLLGDRLFGRIEREAVGLVGLGFSQGCHTITRWATLGDARLDRLILWGGSVPPDLDLEEHGDRLSAARLTIVVGHSDEYVTDAVIERERARLDEAGVAHSLVTYDGGHELDDAVLLELAGETS